MSVHASKPFSLPSAGGVVSLLNEGGPSTGSSKPGTGCGDVKYTSDEGRNTGGSTSSQDVKIDPRFLAPQRSSSSATISTEFSKSPSPNFDSNRSNQTDGSASRTSGHQSTESSNDGSVDSHKRLRRDDSFCTSQEREGWGLGRLAQHSTDSSMHSSDDGRPDSPKDSRKANGAEGHVLAHTRFARSPVPYDRASRVKPSLDNDVPLNMRLATDTHQTDDREVRPHASSGQLRKDGDRHDKDSAFSTRSSARKGATTSRMIGGKKRYPCSHPGCGKTFSTSGHAARHNRIHTGSKPYRCTFPGCSASFSRQDNSLQHYRTHVLHPKGRNGASVDGSNMDQSQFDTELQTLDPETVASVRMGRKALEEGTAIAVVQEYVDGNGRRGEAIQRMVGQSNSGRRGSMAGSATSNTEDWAMDGSAHHLSHDGIAASQGNIAMPRHASLQPEPHADHYSKNVRTPISAPFYQNGNHWNGPASTAHAHEVYPAPSAIHAPYGPSYPHSGANGFGAEHARYSAPSRADAPYAGLRDRYARDGGHLELVSPQYGQPRRASLMTAQQYGDYQSHGDVRAPYAQPHEEDVEGVYRRGSAGHRRVMSGSIMYRSPSAATEHSLSAQQAPPRHAWSPPSRERELPSRSRGGLSLLLTAAASSSAGPLDGARHHKTHASGLPSGDLPATRTLQTPPQLPLSSPLSSPQTQAGSDGMRHHMPSADLRLPLPAVSKMPYSSDRSTTAVGAGITKPAIKTPTIERSLQAMSPQILHHEVDEQGGRFGPRRGTGVQLPSLRSAVTGSGD